MLILKKAARWAAFLDILFQPGLHGKPTFLRHGEGLLKLHFALFVAVGAVPKLGRRRCSLVSKKLRNISRSSLTPYAFVAI